MRYRAAVAESVGGSGEQRMSTETAGRPTVDEQIIAYGIEVSRRLLSPLARTIAPLALRRRGGVEARAD